jgi:hypothetical protein
MPLQIRRNVISLVGILYEVTKERRMWRPRPSLSGPVAITQPFLGPPHKTLFSQRQLYGIQRSHGRTAVTAVKDFHRSLADLRNILYGAHRVMLGGETEFAETRNSERSALLQEVNNI